MRNFQWVLLALVVGMCLSWLLWSKDLRGLFPPGQVRLGLTPLQRQFGFQVDGHKFDGTYNAANAISLERRLPPKLVLNGRLAMELERLSTVAGVTITADWDDL